MVTRGWGVGEGRQTQAAVAGLPGVAPPQPCLFPWTLDHDLPSPPWAPQPSPRFPAGMMSAAPSCGSTDRDTPSPDPLALLTR